MRVLHVVAQIGTYGAERLVAMLLAYGKTANIEQAALTVRTSPADALVKVESPVFDAARTGRYDVGFLQRMIRLIRDYKPDIVHTHTHVGKYFGRVAAIFAGVPVIVHTEHNGFFGAPKMFRPLNQVLIRFTDVVVAFSPSHRDYLMREESLAPERIAVIPNGVPLRDVVNEQTRSLARSKLGVTDERVLLNIARFAPAKNQALAVEALALLDERHRLFFIGDGAERTALENLSRERGVGARVKFLGYQENAAAFMAGADAVVVSSKIEGMPLTVMEAMLTGIPVVSTPWRGASEMLGEGAFGTLVTDFSAGEMAASISRTLDQRSVTRACTDRAVTFARAEFDINTTVNRHADLYRSISPGTRSASRRIMSARS